ncbi:MAG: PspC domain protein [Sphingomonas bacterium]|jgi:phage shock protein C|nr:PspC domain protein [Sphingomonas bacterium]
MSDRLVIDRRRGKWLGVCQGLADYSGLNAGLIRFAFIIATIAGAGLPGIVAYVLIGWLAGER